MEKRQISFSPPDISELEIAEVAEALRSGWITTGPRTKLLERRLAAYVETGETDIDCTTDQKYSNRVVCLNSATAAEELNLRVLGIGEGDEEWGVLLGQPRRKALIYKGFREAEPDPEIVIFYQWQSI